MRREPSVAATAGRVPLSLWDGMRHPGSPPRTGFSVPLLLGPHPRRSEPAAKRRTEAAKGTPPPGKMASWEIDRARGGSRSIKSRAIPFLTQRFFDSGSAAACFDIVGSAPADNRGDYLHLRRITRRGSSAVR